jgi:endonuclease/exonuclease/phosphatase family metal-dependent hydrolase
MIKKCYFLLVFLSISVLTTAQDTIKVMQYNLLNYGNTGLCPNPTLANKDAYFLTIINHVEPDILCVNELANNVTYANRIVANVLNQNGRSGYQRATYTNVANSNLVNMLFFKSDKFGIAKEEVITSVYRDINVYKLYYKQANLATVQDTVFIHFIVAHLKAGNTTNDRTDRATMTTAVMNYLNAIDKRDNYVFCGDFNFYTSAEQGFQNIIAHSNEKIKFYDPINQIGAWSNNSSFQAYHTQSTNTTASGSCHSTGGSDDRFDFIMCSDYILGDSANVKYIPNSYVTVGQDGLRFNQSVMSPTNTAVSTTVANALMNFSDHYPVTANFKITPKYNVSSKKTNAQEQGVVYTNPVSNELQITLEKNSTIKEVSIKNIYGTALKSVLLSNNELNIIDISTYSKGVYLLEFEDNKGRKSIRKLTIN